MSNLTRLLVVFGLVVALPTAAYAQASIAGQVKDASGAVLPGVTVEATSPALIEKVRSVVTDGTGQYRLEILPPGNYTVTFAVAGFNIVKREGIQLSGTFTASVDAQLTVGGLEETITVSGDAPLVDVQNATVQRVVDRELIDALPAGRTPYAQVALLPGVSIAAADQDVGGTRIAGTVVAQIHGTSGNSGMIQVLGLTAATLQNPSNVQFAANMAGTQEIVVDVGGGTGVEVNAPGVRTNVIPREGGNVFNGSFFMNGTGEWLAGSNLTQRLKDQGVRSVSAIRSMLDLNPGFGGPLRRDKLWFYAAVRRATNARWMPDVFYNKNAGNPNSWTHEADLGQPLSNDSYLRDGELRLSSQVAPKVKAGLFWIQQYARNYPAILDFASSPGGTQLSPEAGVYQYFPVERQVTIDVTAPLTNRLLIDGAVKQAAERTLRHPIPGSDPTLINVLEQSTGLQYRARQAFVDRFSDPISYRVSASYITGANAIKVGANDTFGRGYQREWDRVPMSYRFNNGVPNQITQRAVNYEWLLDVEHMLGVYAQDRLTIDRLTLNAGVRFDWFKNSYPAQTIGPTDLAPNRNLSFPKSEGLSLSDLNPRLSAAYDVRGDARTAVRASLNRYVEPYTTTGLPASRVPALRLANSTTRSWTDANSNYVPDCNLISPDANGECGAVANRLFGSLNPEASFDPEVLSGFGHRIYNWEFTVGGEREIMPGLSADISYFRRWYGNLHVVDNRAVTEADFALFSVTAPADPRLPSGGGYSVSELYNVNPNRFGLADNVTTFAKNFGDQVQLWNGVALTTSARLRNGVLLQGGVDTGRQTNDSCEIRAKLPEIAPLNPFCRSSQPVTQLKLLGSYTIPRIELQVSATYQNIPGAEISANVVFLNAQVQPSLGRPLSGNTANITVNVVEPGSTYQKRFQQLDLRLARAVRWGRTKTSLQFDLYNMLNSDAAQTINTAFGPSWLRPQQVILARFAKLGLQFDF